MKKLSEEMPSFELLTPEKKYVNEDKQCNDGEEVQEDACANKIFYDYDLDAAVSEEVKEALSSVGLKRKNQSGEVDSSSWPFDDEVGYVCCYVTLSKNLLSQMDSLSKHIVDYCLDEDKSLKQNETMFLYGGRYTVSREEMVSLYPLSTIFNNVIDAWSLLLNGNEPDKAKPIRFYFDLGHTLYLQKIIDNEANLERCAQSIRCCFQIWADLHKKDLNTVDMHYFAVVIDFKQDKVHYLDNMVHLHPSTYIRAGEIVQNQMAIFLKSLNHVKADAVVNYKFDNVRFIWQTKKGDVDCGIYLMHHMKFFEGDVYSHTDLRKIAIRNALRGQICASIVLSDLNQVRSEVLKKVHDFCKKKPKLIVKLKKPALLKKYKKK